MLPRAGLALAGLVLAVGTASACVAAPRSATPPPLPPAPLASAVTPAPTPLPASRVVVGIDPPAAGFPNPLTAAFPLALQYYWPLYDGLTWLDRRGVIQPGLASSWRSTDGRSWEIRLGDWRFWDDAPVTADDVATTLDFARDPLNRAPGAAPLASIERIEVLSASSLRITVKAVEPRFPAQLANVVVIPAASVAQAGAGQLMTLPPGSGPYWPGARSTPGRGAFDLPPATWQSPRGRPSVPGLDLRYIADAPARTAALRSGEVDVIWPVTPDVANQLRNDGFTIGVDPGQATVSFLLDPFTWPTRDVRVRQAMNLAVDRDRIVKTIFGGYGELDAQLLGRDVPGAAPDLGPWPFDPATARTLLQQAGYPQGLTLPLTVTPSVGAGREVGEAVAADLARVGISTRLVVRDTAAWGADAFGPPNGRQGLWVQVLGWESTGGPSAVYRWFSSETSLQGGRRWDDPVFERLYQDARTSLDETRRTERWQLAARYINEQAPSLFLWRLARPAASNRATNWEPGLYADMWLGRLRKD